MRSAATHGRRLVFLAVTACCMIAAADALYTGIPSLKKRGSNYKRKPAEIFNSQKAQYVREYDAWAKANGHAVEPTTTAKEKEHRGTEDANLDNKLEEDDALLHAGPLLSEGTDTAKVAAINTEPQSPETNEGPEQGQELQGNGEAHEPHNPNEFILGGMENQELVERSPEETAGDIMAHLQTHVNNIFSKVFFPTSKDHTSELIQKARAQKNPVTKPTSNFRSTLLGWDFDG